MNKKKKKAGNPKIIKLGEYIKGDLTLSFKVNPFIIVSSSIVINLLSLALPIVMLQIYDRIIPNKGVATLYFFAIFIFLAVFAEVLLKILRMYLLNWGGAVFEYVASCNLLRRYLFSPIQIKKEINSSPAHYIHQIESVTKIKDFFNGNIIVTLSEIPFLAVYLLVIYYIAGKMVLITMFFLMIFAIISFVGGHVIYQNLILKEKAYQSYYSLLVSFFRSFYDIKLSAGEQGLVSEYDKKHIEYSNAIFSHAEVVNFLHNLNFTFSQTMLISIVSIGSIFIIDGTITMGILVATSMLSSRCLQPVQKILSIWHKYQDYKVEKKELHNMLSLKTLELDYNKKQKNNMSNYLYQKYGFTSLEMENLMIKTNNKIHHSDINITEVKWIGGEMIAFPMGTDQNQASMLLKAISGTFSNKTGSVKLNGEELSANNLLMLEHEVAYVPAKSLIFEGTILDNLTMFGEISEDYIRPLIATLGIDKIINLLPLGERTILKDAEHDAITLATKQLIAIARAIAFRPKILLLDNPQTILDYSGYVLFIKLLHKLKGKILILIASEDKNVTYFADKKYIFTTEGNLKLIDGKEDSFAKGNYYSELII